MEQFAEILEAINRELDREIWFKFNDQTITYRKLFEGMVYSRLADSNKKRHKLFQEMAAHPFGYMLTMNEFLRIGVLHIGLVLIRNLNRTALPENEPPVRFSGAYSSDYGERANRRRGGKFVAPQILPRKEPPALPTPESSRSRVPRGDEDSANYVLKTALGGQSKVSRLFSWQTGVLTVMSARNLCFIQSVLLSVPAE